MNRIRRIFQISTPTKELFIKTIETLLENGFVIGDTRKKSLEKIVTQNRFFILIGYNLKCSKIVYTLDYRYSSNAGGCPIISLEEALKLDY